MKVRQFSLLLVLFFVLSSCFPVTSNSLKKININNTEEEVIRILGKPFSKKAYYTKEYLVYYVHDSFFDVFFNKDQFPFIGFYPILRTGSEYWIIMDNGKVVAFGLSKNFGNSLPKALNNKGTMLEIMEF